MSLSELDITVRGRQGSGKTSLLKLLATALDVHGNVKRYHDESDGERVKVIIYDPEQLAKFVQFDNALQDDGEPWQDIATAPNNQSVILGKAGTPLMVTARRSGPISGWRHCHSSDPVCFEPTHWRHYPEPPKL